MSLLSRSPLLFLSFVAACGASPGDAGKSNTGEDTANTDTLGRPPAWCEGTTAHRWDPHATEDADLFPDGLLEVADPASPTGRSLVMTEDTVPWLAASPALLKEGFEGLNGMSGFGTLGGILLRFTAPVSDVPGSADESTGGAGWQLVELTDAGPRRVPFEADVQEGGLTVILWPLVPLKIGATHAFVMTTDASADDGGCIAPVETTRALLFGDPPAGVPEDAPDRYRAAVDQLGLTPDDISVITVFTAHDETHTFRDLAAVAAEEEVHWVGPPTCTNVGDLTECDATITVLDRRNAKGLIDPTVDPVEAEIPVRIWTPKDREGPWPVVIYGHGLGSRRSEARYVAQAMQGDGYAVVAMEAVLHGDHPSATGGGTTDAAMRFLGVDLTAVKLQPAVLRGNFDQTNLDRVRLIHLIQTDGDFDGDGTDDLDGSQMGYLGISLGAILAPQLLAVTPSLEGAVLSVGGGRLLSIVTDTESLTDFEDILGALVGSTERFDRLVPIAQHVVDPSDSALWGAHVLRDRFDDAEPPSLLFQIGIADEVVPKSAGHALARALGLPHMQPVVETVETLTVVDEDPLAGNMAGGRTAAFFQFDRVTDGSRTVPARHVQTPTSPEGQLQMMTFLETWMDGEPPEAIDPYTVLDTPEL